MTIVQLSDGRPGWRVGAFVTLFFLVFTVAGCATPPSHDYRFDIVQQPVQVGQDSEITVRLVHLPSGQAVKDATISKSELEMPMLRPGYYKVTPSGLSDVSQYVEYLGSDGDGNYRFRGNVSMGGAWAMNIWARVPGEAETIRGTVTFMAAH